MTYFQSKGFTSETLFREVEPRWFGAGTIIKIMTDDNTSHLKFQSTNTDETPKWVYLEHLEVVVRTPYQRKGWDEETTFREINAQWFPRGTVLKLQGDDGTHMPLFADVEGNHSTFFIALDNLVEVRDTPFTRKGFKDDQEFEYIGAYFPNLEGKRVTLQRDDKTHCPYFKIVGGDRNMYLALDNIRPITADKYPSVKVALEEPRDSKYNRTIKDSVGEGKELTVDVYSVLEAFEVTNSAVAHAIKKLLAPGKRGVKSAEQDIEEAIKSLQRAQTM